MDLDRDPRVEPTGKLLSFPQSYRSNASVTSSRDRASKAAATKRRLQRIDAWGVRVWWLLAWIVAACRVHLASARHEVFGVEAALAFLVAVVMPLAHARKLSVALGHVVRASRRAATTPPRSEPFRTPSALNSVGDDHAG